MVNELMSGYDKINYNKWSSVVMNVKYKCNDSRLLKWMPYYDDNACEWMKVNFWHVRTNW